MSLSQFDNLSREELVWLACAVDCEGSISHGHSPNWRISFYNTHKGIVENFALLTGVKVYTRVSNGYSQRALPIHYCSVDRRDKVIDLLTKITPFLIIKKAKAEEALQWYRNNPQGTQREKWLQVRQTAVQVESA